MSAAKASELTHALHEHGWRGLSPEQQDALIASGWHPGPNGGCGKRIKGGYCGTDGVCMRCWDERQFEKRVGGLVDRLRDAAVVIERMANGADRGECSPELDRVMAALREIDGHA